MGITISNPYGTTTFNTVEQFDAFRGLVASGQKVQAIKYMREKEVGWGLIETKEFVDYVTFPPTETTQGDNPFASALREVKYVIREMIAQDYALSRDRLLDLYDKVVDLVK